VGPGALLGPAVELGEGNRVRFKQRYLGWAGRSAKHIKYWLFIDHLLAVYCL